MGNLIEKLKRVKKRWWVMLLAVVAVVMLVISRKAEKEAPAPYEYDPEITPTMFTSDAYSLVSDSGYTRYSIQAPYWYVFDEAEKPNWKFPKGVYGEKYDDNMVVISTFECDSAIYLSQTKLWEFIGNVRINSEGGDKFLTQHMFWDTSKHKMYSDSFIHIERADRIIEGYGFTSNENITAYEVRRPSMILPVSDFNRQSKADEANDSLAAESDSIASDSVIIDNSRKPLGSPSDVNHQRRRVSRPRSGTPEIP